MTAADAVTCRACGRMAGYAAADDPAPGLCPACLELLMEQTTRRAAVLVDLVGPELAAVALEVELVRGGIRPDAAAAFVAAAAAARPRLGWPR